MPSCLSISFKNIVLPETRLTTLNVVPLSSLMVLYFGHATSVYAAIGTVPPMIFRRAPRSTALIAGVGSTIATFT
jgi:hypothetical protein